jgi:hypothetical protein
MAFNTPQFNIPTFGGTTTPITPLLVPTMLTKFLDRKGLSNQFEKVGKNVGFKDAAFESMMKSVGWRGGQAWCSYYVKLIYMQLFSFDRDYISKYFSGGAVQNLLTFESLNRGGDLKYVASRKNDPQIGDIFVLQGHTGIVVEVYGVEGGGYKVLTVEGNTNFKGSREGESTENIKRTLTIGKPTFGQNMLGYVRRNFTKAQIDALYYDEEEGTFKFK